MLLINRLNISSNKTIYGSSSSSSSSSSSRSSLFCLASPSTSTSTSSTSTSSSSSSTSSSSSISPTNIESNDINEIIEDEKENIEIPLLPPSISSESVVAAEFNEMRTLKLGETLKLDEFGPIIINPDGTARRIANWDTLSPQEKASSFRLISARNKKRLQKLKEEQEKKQEDNTS